jgi:hypothetical protein
MIQRATPARDKEFSEQHIIPLRRADGSCPVALRAPADTAATQPRQGAQFKLVGILLLAPAILALSVLILIALLGIFVVWLAIVAAMAAALIISDLIGGLRRAPSALDQRPIPAGQ